VGGIPLQIDDGKTGFLVSTSDECAEQVGWLLGHPAEASAMGARGVEHVRDRFLTTRYLRDYLSIFHDLRRRDGQPSPHPAQQVPR
jgi:trehalose synthase